MPLDYNCHLFVQQTRPGYGQHFSCMPGVSGRIEDVSGDVNVSAGRSS
jgi:hypothetical protein